VHAGPSPIATAITLSVTPGTSVTEGTALTLQASVLTGATPVTRGTVTFYDSVRTLSTVELVYSGSTFALGTANFKLFLGPGSHILKAIYSGTNSYLASTSLTTAVTVTTPSTAVTSTAIISSGSAGNYTLNGKVTAFSSTAATGLVSFTDQTNSNFALGSASLDPATLTNGWQTFTSSATPTATYAILMGDLNGDGIPDLVSGNYGGGTISVFLGNGDGTFQLHMDYAVDSFPFGIAMGDLNGDGIPDLAVASHSNSTVSVLLGNSDGTFQTAQSLLTAGAPQYVAMADFNRDGILDLVTCSSGGSSITLLLGNGDGTFQTEQSFGTSSFSYGLAVDDFNNDGRADVAVSNSDGGVVSIFLSNGNGTFQDEADYTVNSNPTTIAAADLNADGNLDLVVGGQGVSAINVLLGNGDGTFQAKVDYSSFLSPWGVAVADVNGDEFPDVVVASPNALAVEVFRGKGDGTFLPATRTSTSASNYLLALGDLNGDGVVDLAIPSLSSNNAQVALGSISEMATVTAVSIPGGGSHNVVASYAGDMNSESSTSTAISLTGSPFTTTLALNAAPTSGAPGQTFVLTADLSPFSSSGYTAGGTITFFDGATAIGSPVNLASGVASLNKSDFTTGVHNITASYSGDTNFSISNMAAPTTVTVTAPQTISFPAFSPVIFGAAPLTLTATASSELPVAFSVISGPATVSGSTLTITGAGNVIVEAGQAGDSNYQAALAIQRTLAVNKAASSLALMTSAASANPNVNVTFTATVTSPNLPAPTGSAVFLDGATQVATVAFNGSGVATYSTTALTAGVHSITATYAGSANYLSSSSATVIESVVAPDYSIAANPTTLTIMRGNTGTSALTLTPSGGFTGQVAFTCVGQPQYSSCIFLPASVTLPGDDAPDTVQFSLSAIPTPAAASAATLALWAPIGILALVSLTQRRKLAAQLSRTRGLQMLILTALILSITACGGSSARQVPLGTSTVTLTATTVGGTTHHAATITITIAP